MRLHILPHFTKIFFRSIYLRQGQMMLSLNCSLANRLVPRNHYCTCATLCNKCINTNLLYYSRNWKREKIYSKCVLRQRFGRYIIRARQIFPNDLFLYFFSNRLLFININFRDKKNCQKRSHEDVIK